MVTLNAFQFGAIVAFLIIVSAMTGWAVASRRNGNMWETIFAAVICIGPVGGLVVGFVAQAISDYLV
jgi:uncharacterized membrane protein